MSKDWPHTCNLCGSPGLQMFSSLECSNWACKNAAPGVKTKVGAGIDALAKALEAPLTLPSQMCPPTQKFQVGDEVEIKSFVSVWGGCTGFIKSCSGTIYQVEIPLAKPSLPWLANLDESELTLRFRKHFTIYPPGTDIVGVHNGQPILTGKVKSYDFSTGFYRIEFHDGTSGSVDGSIVHQRVFSPGSP